MAAKGNLLFIGLVPSSQDSSPALFYVIDATDMANLKVTGSTLDQETYGFLYGLSLYGSYAYVDTYLKGLVVLDISKPSAPRVLASYDTLAAIPVGISGMHLYAVGYGLDYLSLSDPVHPKREGRARISILSNQAVPWDETRFAGYDMATGNIVLVDFSNPQFPRTVATLPRTPFTALAYCNGSLFLSRNSRSPSMMRFSWDGGDSLREDGLADLPGTGNCLAALGKRVVVGVTPSGYPQALFLLSATGPQSPYVVGECTLPWVPIRLAADGNRIYVDFGDGELVAVEVTEH